MISVMRPPANRPGKLGSRQFSASAEQAKRRSKLRILCRQLQQSRGLGMRKGRSWDETDDEMPGILMMKRLSHVVHRVHEAHRRVLANFDCF